jgi:hypothetical protein
MQTIETRRSDSGRSHPDRHPGLLENLDNPHPGSRRVAAYEACRTAARRGTKGAAARNTPR